MVFRLVTSVFCDVGTDTTAGQLESSSVNLEAVPPVTVTTAQPLRKGLCIVANNG